MVTMKVKWSEENYNLIFTAMMFFLSSYLIFNCSYVTSFVVGGLGLFCVCRISFEDDNITVGSFETSVSVYPQLIFLLLTVWLLLDADAKIALLLTWLRDATIIATVVLVFRPMGEYAADEIRRIISFIILFIIFYVIAINKEYPVINAFSFITCFVVVAYLVLLYMMIWSFFLDEISLVAIDLWEPFLKSPSGVVYMVSVVSLGALVLVSFL